MQGKGNSYILVVEVQTGTITVEINLAIPGEAGNRSASRISYIHHAHIFKGLHILLQRSFSSMVIIALVITASSWENILIANEWTKKMWHIYTIKYYLVAI